MRRTDKLVEAMAIVSKLQLDLTTHCLNRLNFDKNIKAELRPDVQAAYNALERLSDKLGDLYDQEVGITTNSRWEAASRNLGGAK